MRLGQLVSERLLQRLVSPWLRLRDYGLYGYGLYRYGLYSYCLYRHGQLVSERLLQGLVSPWFRLLLLLDSAVVAASPPFALDGSDPELGDADDAADLAAAPRGAAVPDGAPVAAWLAGPPGCVHFGPTLEVI